MALKVISCRIFQNAIACAKVNNFRKPLNSSTFVLNQFNFVRNSGTVPDPKLNKEEVEIVFVKKDGSRIKAKGKIGDTLLDVVVNNNLDFDGFGACEGTLTCSTCHVILSKKDYDKIPEKPTDEEFDMLDLAYDLCDTSRLGCQIELSKDLNGLEVKVPDTVNDARS